MTFEEWLEVFQAGYNKGYSVSFTESEEVYEAGVIESSLKQGAVMVRNNRSKINRFTFYPCNKWGVGWHTRGRKL